MEASGREKDAAGPPWAPSKCTVFRSYAATVGDWADAPSARGNGVAARSSNLRAVRKRPLVTRLTRDIVQTFEKCNPEFIYSDSLNPKRFLTNPAVAVHNDGLDNANSDLILYVNLELVNKKSDRRYIVQEMLGQGTFGQVAKCWDAETNSYVAVKVIKNQPAFYQQAIMEVSLLSMLNDRFDPDDQHHIVRMLDFFPWKNHLCIAFEMLGHNLYELLKKNSLRGLQLKYVRTFSRQILDALVVMKGAGIIHCDLKPENILITPNVKSAAGVKVIDFGSACMEGKTIYSYIQSRYYRSPEVLLGYPYTTAIDMWSFGCIVAELYIGLPLFPGASEYDVLNRMIEIIGGQPPDDLLREAKNTRKFFKHVGSIYPVNGAHDGLGSAYKILTEDEVEARDSKKPNVGKWYFPRGRLDRLIFAYPWKNLNEGDLPEAEKADCLALVDFLRGLVEFDPNKRWSPLQASYHPFITGEAFTGPYEPFRETPIIPVGRAAAVDHNPGGGHWLAAGLSPQVGSINRSLAFNNVFPPKMPLSHGSSYGSFGSHGSFNDNVGPASSYGSYDAHNVNMYHSPLGPSGFNLQPQAGGAFVGFSPDIRRRHHLSHGGGIRSSPGGPGPMSLGASPSQFTPPNSQMQIPTSATAKYVSTSPARGSHGSSMGKAALAGQYTRRRNPGHPPMSMPPHEYTSQPIQGHHGNGVSSAFARGHSGYSYGAVPNSGHYNWRPQIGVSTGLSTNSSSNHGYVQPSNYNDFRPLHSSNVSADTLASASSVPDPADWDPNYSDESLLQEDNSLSAELGSLHLRDASGQTIGSSRLLDIQSHEIASSNPSSMNQRTTGWTACVEGMFKRDIKEKNRDSDDSGTLLTTLEMQGATNEENKKRQNAYIKKIGPWGGDGGLYRDTKVEFVCLKSIKICSGQYVHSLEFSYSDENGMERHAGPWGICDILTSRVLNKIQLGREEFLTGIFGTIDTSNYYGTNIISSLTFITNVGQYGPFGSPGQISFRSPPMSSNSRIVGFFGRSGDLVDAIGLYVKIEREPMDKHDLITKVGPWGGTSGPYHDVDMVPRRLISVVICSGKVIHSLTFIYNDGDGRQHTAGPWGGLGTSKKGAFHTIMLGRSEIVKEVSGTVGPSTVTSLSFVTNIATYGPFGHGEGTPFCSPVQGNDSIVGFFAKAEQHINAIGFYLASTENQDNDGAACTNPHLGDGIKKLDKEFITKIGPWGGCKGNCKDIEAAHLCLNNITIRSGEVVYSLAFSYKDDNGKQHHAGPWGASEGFSYGSFDTIQLGSSEFLTGVSGTIGSSSKYSSNVLTEVSGTTDFSSHYSSDVVTSVIFITNVGRYGPYGGGGGIPFHSPMLSSGSIVGFFAHADRVIDAIGIYVNPEREPTQEQDSVMKIGPWGGDSGRPNDVDALPRHLISVVVHSGDIINSLAFTYLDSDGHEHTAGPWGRMGEPIDGSSHKILLGQSDFLMEVSGTIGSSSQYSDVVTSLFFITNTGSYGPYGKVGGTRFRSPNGSIVGFFVSAEDVIDAIGVYFSLERVTPKEQVEGGSQISTGMTNIIMDSRDRVAIKPESIILEHMLLDRNVEPANVPLALLQHITEDFDVQRVIGVGGFATVYKADLKNGSVAIKKLSNAHTIDEWLFYREATCLISVKHDNIVRFLGYCANTELQAMPHPDPKETPKFIFAEIRERLLCFEYMKNGSLDKYLTDELRGLEWHIRYNIIKGICNGLDYLHNEKSIIHRDLKPANILVDDLMVPKITDFGISKLLEGATHAVTTDPAMSLGYTAPEFIDRHEVSFRTDLFSLGVIIMELVTGRKGDSDINNVCRRWRHRWNKSAKYPPFGYQQVTKCVEIASMCLSDSPNKRPSVRDILNVLNTIENTDVQINSSSESLVGPISPYPWELLDFDKLELNFPFEINKQIPCSLELTNVTNDYVAFNIQNTGTEYCIEPNKGVVPARSKCIVIVTLQARKEVPNAMMCKGEFVVRCAAVNEGLTADDIHEDMFIIKSGKLVDEVPLTVVILCVGAGT